MPFFRRQIAGAAVKASLSSGISAVSTSMSIDQSGGWPDGSVGPFIVCINRGNATEEKVLVTGRSSLTLNTTLANRGYDDTLAAAHLSGESVEIVVGKQDADEANQVVVATLGTVAAKGDLLPGTGAATMGRLAIGTDGQHLAAASSQVSGMQWQTPSVGGVVVTGPASAGQVPIASNSSAGAWTTPAALTSAADAITLNAGGVATAYATPSAQVTAISKNSTGALGGIISRNIAIFFTGAVAAGAWTITGLSTNVLYAGPLCFVGACLTSGTLRSAMMVVTSGASSGAVFVSSNTGTWVAMNTATFAVANNDYLLLAVNA